MARGKRTPPPADETKADKFKRLANARLGRVVAGIESLGKLGGSGYERTPEQVMKVREVLYNTVEAAIERLRPKADDNGAVKEARTWL